MVVECRYEGTALRHTLRQSLGNMIAMPSAALRRMNDSGHTPAIHGLYMVHSSCF